MHWSLLAMLVFLPLGAASGKKNTTNLGVKLHQQLSLHEREEMLLYGGK